MVRIRNILRATLSLPLAIGSLCLLIPTAIFFSGSTRGAAQDQATSQKLDPSDLLGLLDCATRPYQLLAVQPDSYGKEGFRLRYEYPVLPGPEANTLNMMHPANWIALVLYHGDPQYAALFEVGFDGLRTKRTFTLLDGANLELENEQWVVKNILNGGVSTWPEIVRHVDLVTAAPVATIPRASVTRTDAACEFPKPGSIFMAVAPNGERANWKFKDGVSEGLRFAKQFGPLKNNNLEQMPYDTIFMNTYGPN